MRKRTMTDPHGFSQRQAEVVHLAAQGLRQKEMAEQLGISWRTVGHHLGIIYHKTGLATSTPVQLNAKLTKWAIDHGYGEVSNA